MTTTHELDHAISLLKNAVKESHIERQKHIDLSLVMAQDRERYEAALKTTRLAVIEGLIQEAELKKRLGLL
jgi:dsDNA-binding SOS-regulon protein